jgi:hypothetical protein
VVNAVDSAVDIGTTDTEGRWMSYGELAEARQIDRTSALKLALRRKWRKQADNRGTIRVYVPLDWATLADKRAASGTDMSTAIGATEAAIAALRERAQASDQRADQAEARAEAADRRADHAEARADRAEQTTAGERARADTLRDRLDALRSDLTAAKTLQVETEAAMQGRIQAAQDALAMLRQAEADRKARGLLARLGAAVRGR